MRFVLIISQSGFDRDHDTVAFYLSRAVPTLRELAKYLIGSPLITPVKSPSIREIKVRVGTPHDFLSNRRLSLPISHSAAIDLGRVEYAHSFSVSDSRRISSSLESSRQTVAERTGMYPRPSILNGLAA